MGIEEGDRGQPHDERNIPSLREFAERLKSAVRKRLFMSQLVVKGPGSDPAVLQLIGETWGVIREEHGYSLQDVVKRLDSIARFPIDVDYLILFESGWTDPADYREGLIEALGKAYGHQKMAEVHQSFFSAVQNRK